MKEHPGISIIILDSYNPNEEKFVRCLKSFINQDYPDYEIILVLFNKNDSKIVTHLLNKHDISSEKIRIFAYSKNLGYALGNNIGVKKAKNEFVLISNPDVEVSDNFLKKLINSYFYLSKINKTEKIIVGPRICNDQGIIEFSRNKINFMGFHNMDISKSDKIRRTMTTCGCAFLTKKDHFENLNGFDASYFMYHEDIDYSIRASVQGFKQYVDNTIRAYHLKTDLEYRLNNFKYYYYERNRLRNSLEHSKRKKKLLLAHIFFEPFHIVYAIMNGFMKERLKIYQYLISNFSKIMNNKIKENSYLDHYYSIEGIFNEVNINSVIYRILNFYSKVLFYFYHHK